MVEKTYTIIDAWDTSTVGIIAELENQFGGLAYGSVLKSLRSGYSWTVYKRIIPGFVADEVTRYENEAESLMHFRFSSVLAAESAKQQWLAKDNKHIFQYQLEPNGHREKPEAGEILKLLSFEDQKNDLLEAYRKGQRYFEYLDLEEVSFDNENLEGITFENCSLYVSFRNANLRNATFLNGGIKTCDFTEADLTNARFEMLTIESAEFAFAKMEGVQLKDLFAYSQEVSEEMFFRIKEQQEEELRNK